MLRVTRRIDALPVTTDRPVRATFLRTLYPFQTIIALCFSVPAFPHPVFVRPFSQTQPKSKSICHISRKLIIGTTTSFFPLASAVNIIPKRPNLFGTHGDIRHPHPNYARASLPRQVIVHRRIKRTASRHPKDDDQPDFSNIHKSTSGPTWGIASDVGDFSKKTGICNKTQWFLVVRRICRAKAGE
jgi:hypothetical protein